MVGEGGRAAPPRVSVALSQKNPADRKASLDASTNQTVVLHDIFCKLALLLGPVGASYY